MIETRYRPVAAPWQADMSGARTREAARSVRRWLKRITLTRSVSL